VDDQLREGGLICKKSRHSFGSTATQRRHEFGLSWQIVPTALGTTMQDKTPQKYKKVMQAMLQMDSRTSMD
jgi:predicted 3-demethylubiquinone-9 3-methyltransferase (glyoxalase superfamily)